MGADLVVAAVTHHQDLGLKGLIWVEMGHARTKNGLKFGVAGMDNQGAHHRACNIDPKLLLAFGQLFKKAILQQHDVPFPIGFFGRIRLSRRCPAGIGQWHHDLIVRPVFMNGLKHVVWKHVINDAMLEWMS